MCFALHLNVIAHVCNSVHVPESNATVELLQTRSNGLSSVSLELSDAVNMASMSYSDNK